MPHMMSRFLLSAIVGIAPINAYELFLPDLRTDIYSMEFHEEESVQSVLNTVKHCLNADVQSNNYLLMEFTSEGQIVSASAYAISKSAPRDYYLAATPAQKTDLAYILKTLSTNSLAKIASLKSAINKAGDRLESLHPFKFVEIIFTDEQLKVYIRNLEGKSWVWSEFRDGLVNSLKKESAVDNIKPEHVESMANLLKIDVNLVAPIIDEKNWIKLLPELIAIVPRNGDPRRYDQ